MLEKHDIAIGSVLCWAADLSSAKHSQKFKYSAVHSLHLLMSVNFNSERAVTIHWSRVPPLVRAYDSEFKRNSTLHII